MSTKEETLKLVKDGSLQPEEALKRLNRHSTRLSDIEIATYARPLSCGFPTIEQYEYIMQGEGNMIIMAARPGNGKTALACQIGLNVASHSRVLLFSLEMKKEALRKRMISVLSGVPIKKLGNPATLNRVLQAKKEQEQYRLDIIDDNNLTINEIISKVYDEHREEPVSLVIIDYIGLIKVNNEFRATSIGDIAKRIKTDIADRLKIPVIVLAQMNRSFDSRQTQAKDGDEVRPTLADIGESSGIEHASDVVMFLHRPYLTNPNIDPTKFKVYIGKNRNGEVKDFDLTFSQELVKFYDKNEY